MNIDTVEKARKHYAQAIAMGATLEVKIGAGFGGSDLFAAMQYTDIQKGVSARQQLRAKYGWVAVAPEPVAKKAAPKAKATKTTKAAETTDK